MTAIFNRAALRPGMVFGRYTIGSAISQAIVLRTAGVRALASGSAWSHDAMLIQHNSHWYLGDAEMGSRARLTPLEEWEARAERGEIRVIVLWPHGALAEQGQAAAWWWQTHIYGAEYDSLAIGHLAWRWFAEKFAHKVGREDHWYCTEGCRDAWLHGAEIDPWHPKLNVTPGTTRKRLLSGRFGAVHDAIHSDYRRYAISI